MQLAFLAQILISQENKSRDIIRHGWTCVNSFERVLSRKHVNHWTARGGDSYQKVGGGGAQAPYISAPDCLQDSEFEDFVKVSPQVYLW